MRGGDAALPAQFSLLQSEFNAFLFAPIGEESNDSVLTVLSALARLGIDPWQEASRLAQLSKAAAMQRMTSIIAGLPNGRWAPSDASAIATRLIDLLPAKGAAQSLSRGAAQVKVPPASQIAKLTFVAVLGGLILFAIIGRMNLLANIDLPFSTTATSPSAPLAGVK